MGTFAETENAAVKRKLAISVFRSLLVPYMYIDRKPNYLYIHIHIHVYTDTSNRRRKTGPQAFIFTRLPFVIIQTEVGHLSVC
jgi:hypothetical protein